MDMPFPRGLNADAYYAIELETVNSLIADRSQAPACGNATLQRVRTLRSSVGRQPLQASRLHLATRTSFCAEPSGASSCAKSQDAESMRCVDSASLLRCARNDGKGNRHCEERSDEAIQVGGEPQANPDNSFAPHRWGPQAHPNLAILDRHGAKLPRIAQSKRG